MTWNHDADPVAAVGGADGTRRSSVAAAVRELAIGERLAVADLA